MHKNVLSEIALYHGDVSMPKGWAIDREKIKEDILFSNIKKTKLPFSKPWDILNTYLREHFFLEYKFTLVNKESWGDMYKPQETSIPLRNVDPLDLKNAPDFTMLYGVSVKDCFVRIFYDDNRRAGRSWDIPLINNRYLIFPSTNIYCISNKQKDSLNFVQTTTYEYI